ncbi:hypothetical protein [Halobacterium zhouii]|uniref:hypothetical protein n=1 Tax=Halobacterium zhouii TaxID=2902624 RepID=UPI001E4413D4|nr:hypothetical protein [Halobacterium zhouii]
MVEYSGRTLELDAGPIEFPDSIGDVLTVDDGYIVRLQTAGKEGDYDESIDSRNVVKVRADGTEEWRVERADMIAGEYDPFTGLWTEDGEIWAYNFNGLAYQVDPETGELGETRLMK